MHVLYILTKLELGGAQKVCLTLLKGTNGKNISSSLISGAEGVLVEQAKKSGSVYLIENFKREVGFKTVFLELSTFFKMISYMRKMKKKFPKIVVHTHSTKAGLMGRWAALFARVKKRVHTVHGFGFHEHQSRIGWTINFVLEFLTSFITTHYVCVSMADRKVGKKLIPRFWKKSSIIRAAVEWEKFLPATHCESTNCESEKFIFGTVSCLKPQKNLIHLLKAFKLMHDNLSEENKKKVLLQLIGDGVQRPMLEKWLEQNNLMHKVDFLGWQSDVSKFTKTWKVFVMSSLWEGLPCAVVEARLTKLPVVSYEIAGIPEVIKNGQNGFLVPAGNWELLSKKMRSLLENDLLYKNLSQHNDDLNDFKNEVMVANHVKLYQKI